jgi:hypothetical protein
MPTNQRRVEYSPDLEQLSFEEVVERIKKRAPNPANIYAGSQNFDDAFLHGGVEQGMTPDEWDRWWARFEAEQKDRARKERTQE